MKIGTDEKPNPTPIPDINLETHNNPGPFARIIRMNPSKNGTDDIIIDCFGPSCRASRDPSIGPRADPKGMREAIQDASLLVMLKGLSGDCRMTRVGEVHVKHIPAEKSAIEAVNKKNK